MADCRAAWHAQFSKLTPGPLQGAAASEHDDAWKIKTETVMQRVLPMGDYHLVIVAEEKYQPTQPDDVIGFSVRVAVTRIDNWFVFENVVTDQSGELEAENGPFPTVQSALDHGETWGRSRVQAIEAKRQGADLQH